MASFLLRETNYSFWPELLFTRAGSSLKATARIVISSKWHG
jgi:hypothetical protein